MTPAAARALLDVLAARRGLVCTVGAGGKKTTLYRLVEAHLAAKTARIGLTCTVAMAPPPAWLGLPVIEEPSRLTCAVDHLGEDRSLMVYAQPSPKPGRVGGVPPDVVARVHHEGGFEVTLIKADGARMRWIKAPAAGEPVLPSGVTTVLALVSAKIFGRPLTEAVAHRPERVAAVIGARPGDLITPEHVARLLTSERGALRGVGSATVIAIINMVDDEATRMAARATAQEAVAASKRLARVVLARMRDPDPLIEVITP
jgi:probable selenium-dependent hydroxylase accessory protein YqeC